MTKKHLTAIIETRDEKTDKLRKMSSKYQMPTYHLGLSRLYPIGETDDEELKIKNFSMTDYVEAMNQVYNEFENQSK